MSLVKNKYLLSIFISLLLGEVCVAEVLPGCTRAADEATRIETARSILKVNGRVDPETGEKNVDHYHKVINYWAETGSGEDGIGEDGALYQESTLSNFTRQEMWDYLDVVFRWSSDMELVTMEEIWETHDDNSMTYMAVNKWFGNTAGGYYEQPGISIVKFRPDEGCAAYQRDYFTEGDTWWGMSFLQGIVRSNRNTVIRRLELTDTCIDEDGDGYSKYKSALGCPNEGVDCNDYDPAINPGATEILDNGVDENCDANDCFIATAAFGTAMQSDIDVLRQFRDNYLLTNATGKAFVDTYYQYSPPLARYIEERDWLRTMVRGMLKPVVFVVSLLF